MSDALAGMLRAAEDLFRAPALNHRHLIDMLASFRAKWRRARRDAKLRAFPAHRIRRMPRHATGLQRVDVRRLSAELELLEATRNAKPFRDPLRDRSR